jgi:transcriptional regulator with XRE-family HTH domain
MTQNVTQEYRTILSASLQMGRLRVTFADGSEVRIPLRRLVPEYKGKGMAEVQTHGSFLAITVDGKTYEIAWSTIRRAADPRFEQLFAEAATEDRFVVGVRLGELRRKKGMTARRVAKAAGISPQSLSRIENGRHDLVLSTLEKILTAMGSSMQEFMNDSGHPSSSLEKDNPSAIGADPVASEASSLRGIQAEFIKANGERPRKLTRTGPIREGLEYQDAYALLLLTQWLRQPGGYLWIKIEADEYGYLDDIATCSSNSEVRLVQVKYATHPDTPSDVWTWDSLFRERKGKTGPLPSLFRKWFESWIRVTRIGASVKPILTTNRKAAPEIMTCAESVSSTSAKIIPTKLKEKYPEQYQAARKQLDVDDRDEIDTFWKNFEFKFGFLDIEGIYAEAKNEFLKLGLQENGWNNLREALRRWAAQRDMPRAGGRIELDDIRSAAGWHEPKPLNQDFEVPDDFVLDQTFHTSLIAELESPVGGVKVIYGSPGSGKSTYLSFLFKELSKKGNVCLRHHYFLQLRDPQTNIRLTQDRALDSILEQLLREAPESIDTEPYVDPAPRHFETIIRKAAAHFAAKGAAIALIVDGLDHVSRESGAAELRAMLRTLLPVPPGLWLVLGTRESVTEFLPESLFSQAPEDTWIEIKGLSLTGCAKLLLGHREEFGIGDQYHDFDGLVETFRDCTEGHPLHARYTIEALKERTKGRAISRWDFENIPPLSGGIVNYYSNVWRGLSQEGRVICTILATAGFVLSENEIVTCSVPRIGVAADVLRGLAQTKHLFKTTSRGLEFFHSSYSEFVRQTDEYSNLKVNALSAVRDWLEESAPESSRWAHLNRLEYELGNPAPLLSTLSRSWVIDALCVGRPEGNIEEQLALGVHAAMQGEDYARAHSLAVLRSYFRNAPDAAPEPWDDVWLLSWKRTDGLPPLPAPEDLHEFSTRRIVEVAREAGRRGENDFLNSSIAVLADRTTRHRAVPKGEIVDQWWPEARALAEVAALRRDPIERFLRWSASLRTAARSDDVIRIFVTTLAATDQWISVQEVLGAELEAPEKIVVIEEIARAAITKPKKDLWKLIAANSPKFVGPWSHLCLTLAADEVSRPGPYMPRHDDFPDSVEEYLSRVDEIMQAHFISAYIFSLSNGLARNEAAISDWLGNTIRDRWAHNAASCLVRLGLSHGHLMSSNKPPDFEALLVELKDLRIPKFAQERKIWGLWKAFRSALQEVFILTGLLRNLRNATRPGLSRSTMKEFSQSPFFGEDMLTTAIAYLDPQQASAEDIHEYLAGEKRRWDSFVTSFPERSEYYAKLARLAQRYGLGPDSGELLRKAADNLLGYGYHKDLYLGEVLESVEACHDHGSRSGSLWARQLTPLVEYVPDYTDGDETNHLHNDLADLFLKVDRDLLRAYYVHLASSEEFFHAEDVFPKVVASLELNDPVSFAVACTAADYKTTSSLLKRGERGDANALKAIEKLLSVFHALPSAKAESNRQHDDSLRPRPREAPDYDEVKPAKLHTHLKTLSTPHEQNEFLLGWIKKWLADQKTSRAAYVQLRDWLRSLDSTLFEGAVLEALVPYAREFEGPDAAFDVFCQAVGLDYVWSRYWRRFQEVEKTWDRLETEFPGREREFIRKTLHKNRYGIPENRVSSLPIPRGVQFLAKFGHLAEAEALTAAAVRSVQDLTADLQLPHSSWIADSDQIDTWGVLFARLCWPGPIVRERAASEICDLLLSPHTAETAFDRISRFILNAKLETVLVLGLLPIAKAARESRGKLAIDLAKLDAAVSHSRPSVLSTLIMQDVNNQIRKFRKP